MSDLAYSVEREYPVPIDRMWHAWTDASALQEWYAPTGLAVVSGSTVSEPVIGGRWATAVDASAYGHVAYFWGRYSEVDEPMRVVHSMSYSQDESDFLEHSDEAEQHLVTIDMEPRGEGCWVRFAQYGDMPAEQAQMAQQGLESYFDSLGNFLTR